MNKQQGILVSEVKKADMKFECWNEKLSNYFHSLLFLHFIETKIGRWRSTEGQ